MNILVSLFDVTSDLENPEQNYCITKLLPKYKDTTITSFCFSNLKSNWDLFSVYFQTKSGQIFLLCPVIPYNMLVNIFIFNTICLLKNNQIL